MHVVSLPAVFLYLLFILFISLQDEDNPGLAALSAKSRGMP
ncbi:hypothetical protein GWL_20320 [Herbaspirillum sp. GW103]|nr:hypothetical protein GWL_20320 [Herbaspirillum sp. GW103]